MPNAGAHDGDTAAGVSTADGRTERARRRAYRQVFELRERQRLAYENVADELGGSAELRVVSCGREELAEA